MTDAPQSCPSGKSPYQVGTLVYTKMGLVGLFFWLLWGDFCITLLETVMPTLLPLKLKDSGASNFMIGLVVSTIPYILNATVCPFVSTWSDRHRGPRGRRIPFILWPLPFIVLFLILVGCSSDIGAWLHSLMSDHTNLGLTKVSVILGVAIVFVLAFSTFNMFIASVYYYLWADVVPQKFLGRFMSLARMVNMGGMWVWSYYIFGLADTHMRAIYIGIGALTFVGFTVMCLRVKEGDYPPPSPPRHGGGATGWLRTYFEECFRNPYYLVFFVGSTFYQIFWCGQRLFLIFFYRDQLHLSLDQIGKVNAWCMFLSLLLFFPAGYFSDKIHPLRMNLISMVGLLVTSLLCFRYIHDQNSMLIFLLAAQVPLVFAMASNQPMMVSLMPNERYGQFCSAQSMMSSVGNIAGNTLLSLFLDWVKDYRYGFLWQAVFSAATIVPMLYVYAGWRRYGGPKHYVAPSVDLSAPVGNVPAEETPVE